MPTPIQRVFAAVVVIIITAVLIGLVRRSNIEDGTAEARDELKRSLQDGIASLSFLFLVIILSGLLTFELVGIGLVTGCGLCVYFMLRMNITKIDQQASHITELINASVDPTMGTVIAAKRLPPANVPRTVPNLADDDLGAERQTVDETVHAAADQHQDTSDETARIH